MSRYRLIMWLYAISYALFLISLFILSLSSPPVRVIVHG